MDITGTMITAAAAVISALIGGAALLGASGRLKLLDRKADRKYRDLPIYDSRRNAIATSSWSGEVDQLKGPSGEPERYPFTLSLDLTKRIVSGELSFTYKDRKSRCDVRGGFIEGSRFLQLDYQDLDPKVARYGTMFFLLNSDGDSMAGHFLGYAPEMEGLANGSLSCSRD